MPKRTAKACGSDAPTQASSSREFFLRATVSTKHGHREEHAATVKHCAEMPGVSGVTVAHYAHVLAAGASAPGIPAPSDGRVEES